MFSTLFLHDTKKNGMCFQTEYMETEEEDSLQNCYG